MYFVMIERKKNFFTKKKKKKKHGDTKNQSDQWRGMASHK